MDQRRNPDALAAAIDGWADGVSGLRIAVQSSVAHVLTGLVNVEAVVLSPTGDVPVGAIELSSQPDRTVHLTTVELAEAVQRRGFSRSFIEHLALALPRLGCQSVSLMAMGVGGYAWAAIGFELDNRARPAGVSLAEATRRLLLAREHRLVLLEADAPHGGALGAKLRRAAGLEPGSVASVPGVRALAQFGSDQPWLDAGSPTWFGRELLIGAQWLGRRYLVTDAR